MEKSICPVHRMPTEFLWAGVQRTQGSQGKGQFLEAASFPTTVLSPRGVLKTSITYKLRVAPKNLHADILFDRKKKRGRLTEEGSFSKALSQPSVSPLRDSSGASAHQEKPQPFSCSVPFSQTLFLLFSSQEQSLALFILTPVKGARSSLS